MGLVCTVTAVLRIFFFDVNVVHGTSMCTTLYEGDILLARKFDTEHINRGDIVTANRSGEDRLLVKRVIGLPNEHITIDDEGWIYADGVPIDDAYQSPTVGLVFQYTDITLGDDEYFLMGDNRYDSWDSRNFGPVHAGDIRDVVMFRFFPPEIY